jgi:hypothetical protein
MKFKYTGAAWGVLPWDDYETIRAELEAELAALATEIQATRDTVTELTSEGN